MYHERHPPDLIFCGLDRMGLPYLRRRFEKKNWSRRDTELGREYLMIVRRVPCAADGQVAKSSEKDVNETTFQIPALKSQEWVRRWRFCADLDVSCACSPKLRPCKCTCNVCRPCEASEACPTLDEIRSWVDDRCLPTQGSLPLLAANEDLDKDEDGKWRDLLGKYVPMWCKRTRAFHRTPIRASCASPADATGHHPTIDESMNRTWRYALHTSASA